MLRVLCERGLSTGGNADSTFACFPKSKNVLFCSGQRVLSSSQKSLKLHQFYFNSSFLQKSPFWGVGGWSAKSRKSWDEVAACENSCSLDTFIRFNLPLHCAWWIFTPRPHRVRDAWRCTKWLSSPLFALYCSCCTVCEHPNSCRIFASPLLV